VVDAVLKRKGPDDEFVGLGAADLPADPTAAYDFAMKECKHMRLNFHSDKTGCMDSESNNAFGKIDAICKDLKTKLKPATPGGGRKDSSMGLITALASVTVAMAFYAQ
jgi:hypothetical protein